MANISIREVFDRYFNGEKNFMTPKVYGYDQIFVRNGIVFVEKSKNVENTLYGVTTLFYNKYEKTVNRIDLSKSFGSAKDALKYIHSITNSMVEKADLYGETMKI